MKRAFRITHFLSIISIIAMTLMFGFAIFKQFVVSPAPHSVASPSNAAVKLEGPTVKSAPSRVSPIGKPVPLENVNWNETRHTLIMYFSTTCRYCNESMSFYKALIEKSGKDAKFVAVLPQTIEDATQHLKTSRLDINEVHNASLSSIGVTATPTLLLVGQDGIVVESWRGKLKADKEAEVFAKLSS